MNLGHSYADRETGVYHNLRQLEDWRGFVAKARDPEDAARVQKELNAILAETEVLPRFAVKITDDDILYCRGLYSNEQSSIIGKYLKAETPLSVVVRGSYAQFNNPSWVRKVRDDYDI